MKPIAPSSAPRTEGGGVVYWLPLDSALAHFEVTRRELVRAVKVGELCSRRIVCGEDLAVALSSAELLERYPRRSKPRRVASLTPALIEQQSAELARVQAELDAAERVERALQRYADRLEAELERARRETLVLARALGRAEGRAETLSEAPRRVVEVGTGAKSRARAR